MSGHLATERAGGAAEDRKRPLGQDPRPRHLQIFFSRIDFCTPQTPALPHDYWGSLNV